MAYHDDLLTLARELVNKGPSATQADLRRAVSTAYYAIFHLLVSEATLNWSRDSSRNALGRMFDHGLMKRVSERVADRRQTPFAGEHQRLAVDLRLVAHNSLSCRRGDTLLITTTGRSGQRTRPRKRSTAQNSPLSFGMASGRKISHRSISSLF